MAFLGISMHFFSKKIYYQHVRNSVLAVCAKLVPLWGKGREMRGNEMGRKIISTCPFYQRCKRETTPSTIKYFIMSAFPLSGNSTYVVEAGSGDSFSNSSSNALQPHISFEKQCNLTVKQNAKIDNILIYEL